MSLTVRHLLLSTVAVASALTASLVTIPQAGHTITDAQLRRSQADAVSALPGASAAQRKSLTDLRRALPADLASEQAQQALTGLAEAHQLAWDTVTSTNPTTRAVHTSVGDVTITTLTLTAHLTGARDNVLALLAALPTARPLMSVEHLQLASPTPTTRDLTLTVTAHAARPAQ